MVLTGAAANVLAGVWSPELLVNSLYLVGALLAGAIVIAAVSRWRRRGAEPLTPGDQLAHFRSLYEVGELSAEEFARLRAMLTGPVHQAAAGKPGPTGVSPQPGPPPPDDPPPPGEGIRPA
jgi:hypothetical protein